MVGEKIQTETIPVVGITVIMVAITEVILDFAALPLGMENNQPRNQEAAVRDIGPSLQMAHIGNLCHQTSMGLHQQEPGDSLGQQDTPGTQDQVGLQGHQATNRNTLAATTSLVNGIPDQRTFTMKNLSFQIFNVCGLRNKLDIPEFRDTLEMYDISLLCESKLDKADEDYILSVITPLSLNAYFKHRKTLSARRSGGLCILYKEHLDKYITHIVTKCKLIQWLRISKQLTGADKDIMIGNTYIPPKGTRYENLTPFQYL